ncbi:MAG: PAS domain-containing protein [Chitinophagaceae bacterium]|nr:PAS domain-containing protein [Chitinophagaceae bacterium]
MSNSAHDRSASYREDELSTLRELLNESEHMLNFGTWNQDISTGKIGWSQGMYNLMGYRRPDIEERLNADFYVSHIIEADREGFGKTMAEAIARLGHFELTYALNNNRNEELTVLTRGKVLAGEDGKALKISGVTKNITQIRDYEQSLEEKLRELDKSNKELEEFAYVASHDLQEPLRKITSFGERLQEKIGAQADKDIQFYLTRMLVAAENMRNLIENLLEFSRTSRHSQPFETVNLADILAEAKAEFELKIEETNAIVHAENMPLIRAIPSQMRQLLTNMLSNAIKFRKSGIPPEIVFTSKILSKEECKNYRLHNHKLWRQISIKDNGIGFEQEFASKIFQIFQRLHGKSEYPGAGIGLAICKKIVENHKGIIFANSEPGKGAEFIILLPEI